MDPGFGILNKIYQNLPSIQKTNSLRKQKYCKKPFNKLKAYY